MAATNYTPIQLYYSTTASAAPTAGNLTSGELAINITDGKLYYKDNGGVVQVIATKGAGTIGGSTTQIQYNNAGALAGNAAMTFNSGTSTTTLTTLNLTNALGAIYGGTAQSTYTQGDFLYASATNTLSKLGIGTVNYILTSTGSVPQWVAPSSVTVQTANNLAGGLGGSVPYQSAVDTTTFLAIGTANRVMTSSGTAPQWVTALTSLTGVSSSSITNTSLTSGRVVVSTTGGLQADDADLTFNGTTLSAGGYSTTGLSTLVQTVTIGNSNFSGTAVFAPATPAKLYIGTGTVTDTTSAIGATNATGAVSSLAITPIAASNTSVTYTNASTLYIAGAPSAGTNVTITNPYSLYIAAGASYFGGTTNHIGVATFTTDITVNSLTVGRGAGAVGSNTAVGQNALAANTTGANNSGFGATALGNNTTGGGNSAVGSSALRNNSTGSDNTALGNGALNSNTTASNNTAVGVSALTFNIASSNTAVGYQAAYTSTTATEITALGYKALFANTANSNTALGERSMQANTTGTQNTAVGSFSLASNTTGNYNVVMGREALSLNTSGVNNTAIGTYALNSNTTGSNLDAFGRDSLGSNTTGTNNTGIANSALFANTTGSYNVAVGIQALQANTTSSDNTAVGYRASYSGNGSQTTAVGREALYNNTAPYLTAVGYRALYSNTTGAGNVAVGLEALFSNTTGASNVAMGAYNGSNVDAALRANTTGGYNVAIGIGTLANNTTASNNTAVGYQAGYSNTTGAQNTFAGYQAGYQNTTASFNTALGYTALFSGSTGQQNVALGREVLYNTTTGSFNTGAGLAALYQNTTGSYNTAFGQVALFSATTGSVNTVLGYNSGNAITTGSKNTILGSYSGNNGGLDIRTASNYIVLSDGDGNPRMWASSGQDGAISTPSANYRSTRVVTISALNTDYPLYLFAISAILYFRDNSAGGSAAYLWDPNTGLVPIASSLSGKTLAFSFSGGITYVRQTAGSVPTNYTYNALSA